MIITTIVIIGTLIGLGTGLISGSAIGYAIGNRRNRELDEQHNRLVEYYTEPHPEYEFSDDRTVFSVL